MAAENADSQLGISWHDSAWIPVLNPGNILEYFSQRTNPFYDRTCNNEVVKMQRLDPSNLQNMTGIEYKVLHVQDPILYVIRKQHRHSPTQETPIADYYILAGVVYQAPDLCSVINSRLLSALHNFQSAFDEAISYSRYHPSKGYWWQFKDSQKNDGSGKKSEKAKKDDPSSAFQREGVNLLLGELTRKFPPNFIEHGATTATAGQTKKNNEEGESETTAAKDQLQSQGIAGNVVTNGSQGGAGASQSQGIAARVLSAGQQLNKRTGSNEGAVKQPPSKRKKT